MKAKANELPIVLFENQQAFEEWLADHYDKSPGIRMQIAKKNSGLTSASYAEALDVALCYGWIDSQKESLDERSYLQRFTPRGPKSIWSKVNVGKVEQLIANGRMKPPGLEAIEKAKQNGLWDKAYASSSNVTMPEDLAAALEQNAKAAAFYETLNKQNKFAILFRIHNVKKEETRKKKIMQFVEMLEKGEKIYP
jgi:Uncharacterized protein conserved in bacteria